MTPAWRRFIIGASLVYAVVVTLMQVWLAPPAVILLSLSTIGLIIAGIVPLLFWRKEYGWFHPLIFSSVFFLVEVAIRRTGLFIGGLDYHAMLPEYSIAQLNGLVAYGNFLWVLGMLAAYAGYALGPKHLAIPANWPPFPNNFYTPVMVLCFVVSMSGLAIYIEISGGFSNALLNLSKSSIDKVFTIETTSLGIFNILIKLGVAVVLVWLATNPNVLRKGWPWLVIFATCLAGYMIGGKRSQMIYPAVLFCMIWAMTSRRLPFKALAGIVVLTICLFGLLGVFRTANWSNEQVNTNVLMETSMGDALEAALHENARRVGSETTLYPILARVPSEVDPLYGESYMEFLYRFVPRYVWNTKPRGVGVRANREFSSRASDYYAIPPGVIGEAYWNFHVFGVVLVYFLTGLFWRWLAERMTRFRLTPGIVVLYVPTLFYLRISQDAFTEWLYVFTPTLLVLWLTGLLPISSSGQFASRSQVSAVRRITDSHRS